MKSSFSRSFFPAVLILLMALSVVGVMFQVLARNVMESRSLDRLEVQAQTVSRLASAYHESRSRLDEDFYLNLTVSSQVSGADTVICDSDGQLIVCSDSPIGCQHQGLFLDREYIQKVCRDGLVSLSKLSPIRQSTRKAQNLKAFLRNTANSKVCLKTLSVGRRSCRKLPTVLPCWRRKAMQKCANLPKLS